ncbi:RNA-binding S4 domain-containing protein [Pseudoruegeria sp. HB172150]|uniref:RNA-binding S4 domain-containing protein n=1 Tax=Pseudoruegeria sp. HB172150 TaxID=2721164 RepID=UPI001556B576|nr:RNA-binding S4 domain-containing protein [Pseudoruegeria sp. HB172150]
MPEAPRQTIRIDKWLWYARFFKTRGLAAKTVSAGHVRVNTGRVSKPAHTVGAGDTLTFPQAHRIRVVRILATGTRRGPAPEAQALYEDLTPAQEKAPPAPKFDGGGRPTKKDRRTADSIRHRDLE